MQSQLLGHALIGFTMLTSLLWLGALPTDIVFRAAELLAVWCLLSTIIVVCAGAWVALGRSRRRETEPLKARQLQ